MHYFESANTFDVAYNGDEYHEPWVSLTMQNRDVHYNKNKEIPLEETPLTFEIQGDGNIYWCCSEGLPTEEGRATIEYSKNGGEWTSITAGNFNGYSQSGDTFIPVVSGDVIQFRGDNPTYGISDTYQSKGCFQSSSATFKIKGNIMSLIDSTNFSTVNSFDNGAEAIFIYMFSHCTGLIDASELILPTITLADYCYSYMFYSCSSLTIVPELPATTLADYCYQYMFGGCNSLTTAPELPATTLAECCYANMFADCSNLTTVSELPATTLAGWCYGSMFQGCSSLTTAPELPATTLARYCYLQMFDGCTNLTTAPELPATTLAECCYDSMFLDCTNLNYIKCLATDISASDCTSNWVYNVASSGTFVKDPSMTSWTTGTNGIPSGWTSVDI